MVEISSTIQKDIMELERQLEEKKADLEHEKSEKDVLREVVGEKIQSRLKESRILDSGNESGQHLPPVAEPPSYLAQELKDKIAEIVKLTFDKSLDEGIKEAAKSGNMALIDAFHDILTDELYNQLLEQRKLDKVD